MVEIVMAAELGVESISVDPLPFGGPVQRESCDGRDFEFPCPRVEWVKGGRRLAVFVPVATEKTIIGQWPFERTVIRQDDRATLDNFRQIFRESESS